MTGGFTDLAIWLMRIPPGGSILRERRITMETALATLSNELAALAERGASSVVAINARRRSHSSGVHWRQGLVVTAEHSVRRDEAITVLPAGGATLEATLVGRDPGTDLALLKVDGLSAPPATTGPGPSPRVGDIALIIGRSPNSGPNASMGIISAVSGPWRSWRGGNLDAYIRLGAAVFAGSSGGAVIDHRGTVTGIATSALSRVAGLSIPSSTVNRVVDELLAHGGVPQAYLGVGLQPVPIPASFRSRLSIPNTDGIMVLEVEQGGPADRSGILVGDIVFAIEGNGVASIEEVQSLIAMKKGGKTVTARLIRGGELKEITLTIGERAREAGR
jgi:S1-C subfamily serine protease